ncbi:hypothetical protein GPJ56_008549 [Histomonas meleagridis]|uniref:uncharacterized protein n=1 Tax=Histomonas meleagridis TaxID=135588 RepID=UPI0035599F75|nr:hypothetical protein GPJ56_008549 [Histomonas meleagridis]KAH0798312.1 hypothetical protein GO595_008861 [Histomonas meleagridis]
MKTVYIRYPSETGPKREKLKLSGTVSGKILRPIIAKNLPQFADNQYFFSQDWVDGRIVSINENDALTHFPGSKKIRLQLTPNKVKTNVHFADGTSVQAEINTKESAAQSLSNFTDNPQRYVFCYRLFSDPSYFHSCALSIPLSYQQWTNEDLYVVRRVTLSDLQGLNDPEKIHELYLQCKHSITMQMCIFANNTLCAISVLQFIIKGNNIDAITKQGLLGSLPPWAQSLMKSYENFDSNAIIFKNKYSKFTITEAELEFIKIASSQGAICYFIDSVRFQIIGRKWKPSSNRYLKISPTIICITKSTDSAPRHQELTSSIIDVILDGDSVTYVFEFGKKWKVRSEHSHVLMAASQEIIALAKQDKPFQTVPSLPSTNEQPQTKEVDATKPSQITREISIESDEIEIDNENDQEDVNIKSDDSSDASESDVFLPEKTLKKNVEEEVVDTCKRKFVPVQPGISMLVCPDENEENVPYEIESKCYRNLKVMENVEPVPYKGDEKKKLVELSFDSILHSQNDFKKMAIVVVILGVLYIIFK